MPSSGPVALTACTRSQSASATSPSRARQVVPALMTRPWTLRMLQGRRRARPSRRGRRRRGGAVLDAGRFSALLEVGQTTVRPRRRARRPPRRRPCAAPAGDHRPRPLAATWRPVSSDAASLTPARSRRTAGAQRAGPRPRPGRRHRRAGSTPATTRLGIVPRPSTVRVTTSPGRSGGSSSREAPRPQSSARQPPLPQVPEPRTSPGRTVGAARGVGDEVLEGPAHVGEQVLADDAAVDSTRSGRGQEAVGVAVGLELVGGDQPRAERGGGVLALGRAEARPASRGPAGRGRTSR